ncbi:MAG: carbohydrate ABC transporter permease, partial [Microlunatus sp.]|nr:carbohydrate ABC transporter permease [Microlunatus sp.]
MTDTSVRTGLEQGAADVQPQAGTLGRKSRPLDERGQWGRFVLILIVTALAIIPIVVVFYLSLQPGFGSQATGMSLDNFGIVFSQTRLTYWLENSLLVTIVTVILAVAIAAPAGYVVSRVRNKWVSGYSLVLFIIQSLPVITAVIPLFFLFTPFGLVDNLLGVIIIYVGGTISVATWMMAAYFDSIPIDLEEAAWIDGLSVFGGFLRVVLRNSLPGILSTAIFSFLLGWNDYLVASVFLRSDVNYT